MWLEQGPEDLPSLKEQLESQSSRFKYLIMLFRISISHSLLIDSLRNCVLLKKSVRCGDGSPL